MATESIGGSRGILYNVGERRRRDDNLYTIHTCYAVYKYASSWAINSATDKENSTSKDDMFHHSVAHEAYA
jgi:hypothetical protein